MDLEVPIAITEELTDAVVSAHGVLNLASGSIRDVRYVDYDAQKLGAPFERRDYEFTSGTLSNQGKDVEFSIEVNKTSGQYSVSASELLEIKLRAAALFAGVSGRELLDKAGAAQAPAAGGGLRRRLH